MTLALISMGRLDYMFDVPVYIAVSPDLYTRNFRSVVSITYPCGVGLGTIILHHLYLCTCVVAHSHEYWFSIAFKRNEGMSNELVRNLLKNYLVRERERERKKERDWYLVSMNLYCYLLHHFTAPKYASPPGWGQWLQVSQFREKCWYISSCHCHDV